MSEKFEKWKKDFMKTINIADPTGFNADIYKKFFDGINEAEFIKLLKNPDFKLTLHMEEYDHEIMFRNLRDACVQCNAVYQERVFEPRLRKVSPKAYPGAPMIYNMLHQRSESESYVASDTISRNAVGQVTGDSNGAQFSKPETVAALSVNRYKLSEEMARVRSGSDHIRTQVYKGIIENGYGDMDAVDIDNNKRKEINMLRGMYTGMDLKMEG